MRIPTLARFYTVHRCGHDRFEVRTYTRTPDPASLPAGSTILRAIDGLGGCVALVPIEPAPEPPGRDRPPSRPTRAGTPVAATSGTAARSIAAPPPHPPRPAR